jgi:hypothetical protein
MVVEAKHGVVAVVIQYRLGIFGAFSSPTPLVYVLKKMQGSFQVLLSRKGASSMLDYVSITLGAAQVYF